MGDLYKLASHSVVLGLLDYYKRVYYSNRVSKKIADPGCGWEATNMCSVRGEKAKFLFSLGYYLYGYKEMGKGGN